MTAMPPDGTTAGYPEKSQASTALVLAIVGLCCGPVGVVGLVLGYNEKKAIEAGRRDPSTAGTANAAFIIGIVTTVLWVIVLILNVGGVLGGIGDLR